MKKKILILSMVYFPIKVGGAETSIKEITDRLSEDEYEFHMICNGYDSTFPKTEKIGHVTVHRIGLSIKNPTIPDLRKLPLHLNKLIYQWQAYFVAKRLHKTEQFDGIWAMMAHGSGVPAGMFKRAFPKVKYLLTLQEGDPPAYIESKMRIFGRRFDQAFTEADMIQVISSFLGRWAKQKGFKKEPVLIPNAVDSAHFAQDHSDQELREVRRELGVSDDDVLLVTTSRLVIKNAVDDVISAVKLLPEKVKFIIFGFGPEETALGEQIEKLGLKDRVFLKGHIDHAVMPKYLKACDIFIRPSRSEGMGNSFIEAMVAELPVIATQEGGIADFLFDEKRDPEKTTTGWAVDANSPTQIKEAVEDIMNRSEKVARVVADAKKMAVENYDWDLIANRMNREVFKELFRD